MAIIACDSNTMRFIIMVFAIVLKLMNAFFLVSPTRQMRNTAKMLAARARATLKATTTVSTL